MLACKTRFPIFAELSSFDLHQLAREFQGPFFIPPGASLFEVGELGDFLYLILAGEIVCRRGKKELRRYRRGGFVGETALLGPSPTKRIFAARVARGGPGCAVLRPSASEVPVTSSVLQHQVGVELRNAPYILPEGLKDWRATEQHRGPGQVEISGEAWGVNGASGCGRLLGWLALVPNGCQFQGLDHVPAGSSDICESTIPRTCIALHFGSVRNPLLFFSFSCYSGSNGPELWKLCWMR